MEEKRRGAQPPLKVERQFAGSRLEQQILIRVYELAAPSMHQRTNAIPLFEPHDQLVSDTFQSQRVAKGA
jgi:hypothetical protein